MHPPAEKYVNRDTLVLDVGTGSGILGITALKLGAKEVWGTDLDENAINAVRENLEANSIPEDRFHVLQGNIIDDVSVKEWAGYVSTMWQWQHTGGCYYSAGG